MPTLTGKLVYGVCTFVPNILHETLISPAAKGEGSLDSISSNMVYFCTFLVLQSNNIGLFGSLRSQKTQTAAFLVYAWGTGVFRLYQGFQADGCEYWGSTLYATFQYPIITLSLGIMAVLPIRLLQEGLSPFLPTDPRWRFVLEFIVTYIFNSICIFLNVTLGLHLSSVLFRQSMAGECPELSGSSIGLLFVGTLLLMVLLLAAIGMVIYTLMRARYVEACLWLAFMNSCPPHVLLLLLVLSVRPMLHPTRSCSFRCLFADTCCVPNTPCPKYNTSTV